MAECKECLYYEGCPLGLAIKGSTGTCLNFKNKADFGEVVRCKDCKFNVENMKKDPLDITDYSGDDIVCSYFMTDGLDPNDYCSQGERTPQKEGRGWYGGIFGDIGGDLYSNLDFDSDYILHKEGRSEAK